MTNTPKPLTRSEMFDSRRNELLEQIAEGGGGGGSGGNVLVVHMDKWPSGSRNSHLDKTFAQIASAIRGGQGVMVVCDSGPGTSEQIDFFTPNFLHAYLQEEEETVILVYEFEVCQVDHAGTHRLSFSALSPDGVLLN